MLPHFTIQYNTISCADDVNNYFRTCTTQRDVQDKV